MNKVKAIKKYEYINDIGEPKILVIGDKIDNGKYPYNLWSNRTGDLCGYGTLEEEELKDWLNHYGVEM